MYSSAQGGSAFQYKACDLREKINYKKKITSSNNTDRKVSYFHIINSFQASFQQIDQFLRTLSTTVGVLHYPAYFWISTREFRYLFGHRNGAILETHDWRR